MLLKIARNLPQDKEYKTGRSKQNKHPTVMVPDRLSMGFTSSLEGGTGEGRY